MPSALPRSKTAAHETARAARAVVVPEPEPLYDVERARLENIRRNQEALAGTQPWSVSPARLPDALVALTTRAFLSRSPHGRREGPACADQPGCGCDTPRPQATGALPPRPVTGVALWPTVALLAAWHAGRACI